MDVPLTLRGPLDRPALAAMSERERQPRRAAYPVRVTDRLRGEGDSSFMSCRNTSGFRIECRR